MAETNITKVPFRPVFCNEQVIKKKQAEPVNGHVYFTTDTKKIFLGQNGNFLPMCSSSGFFYGIKDILYENNGLAPDPNVTFYFEEIEGDAIPEVDDLILNIDGCFYRIIKVNEDSGFLETVRLTLQGTGTGGSGGGGEGGSTSNFILSSVGSTSQYISSKAEKATINIITYSSDSTNFLSSVSCGFMDGKNKLSAFYKKEGLQYPLEKAYEIDITNQLSNITEYGSNLYVEVTDKYGTIRSITTFTVYSVNLSLTKEEPEIVKTNNLEYSFYLSVASGVTSYDNRTVYCYLYEEGTENEVLVRSISLENNQSGRISIPLVLNEINHGVYDLKIQAIGTINNGQDKIFSNILTHKFFRYDSNVGTALFTTAYEPTIEQYTESSISCYLATGNNNTYELETYINNVFYNKYKIQANTILPIILTPFESVGEHILTIKIPNLGIIKEYNIIVNKYSGELPIINTNRTDLILYLNPVGKTNDSTTKTTWFSQNGNQTGYLYDFYYGTNNGWLKDTIDGYQISCLKLSKGASLQLPDFAPFAFDPMQQQGMTIELDFKIDGVTDYDTELIKCISTNKDGVIQCGFAITGNTMKFYTNSTQSTLNLVEGKRIKLTYLIEPRKNQKFPMVYTYLDGIISKVISYAETDSFKESTDHPARLQITSEAGEVYVYGIRFYNTALNESVILNNQQATIPSLANREKEYLSNLILDNDGNIVLSAVESIAYDLGIPLVKITGGWSCTKKFQMGAAGAGGKFTLPTGKKDYRLVDVSIRYPDNEYFKDYEDFSEICTFSDPSLTVTTGFGQQALTGAMIYAQGTSSLEYPVKNLRMKFKSKKISVRPDLGLTPVNLICFKADFMESSGSHNTGAANFIDDLYEYADGGRMMTPAQKYFSDEKIVTCIKGHPCVIFWSPSGAQGTYQYIGKYNLNLDKATPEPFGFKHDSDFNDLSNTPAAKFGYQLDENGAFIEKDGLKKNSIYCYEFLDNAVKVCNFLPEEGLTYEQTWYNTFISDGKTLPGWRKGFESRYPEDEEGLHDADGLWEMASWLNELYNLRQSDEQKALNRFAAEYECYFDSDFLLAYYVITYTLLMTDSRVKNLMIATWGREKRSYIDVDTGKKIETYKYIWYPIFYDMDTMFGLDNTGVDKFSYSAEDNIESIFNGDEILWKFVRDALPEKVKIMFSKLETGNSLLTSKGIIPYFNDNQADMANEAFYNGDARYKYINTYRNGYENHLTGEVYAPGASPRLYAAQGSRSLTREYFIINRVNFLRAMYESNLYKTSDRIDFRINYPKSGNDYNIDAGSARYFTSERLAASLSAVKPSGDLTLTSLKTGYAGFMIGRNGTLKNQRFNDEETKTIAVDTTSASGTEAYILGINILSDLGDLSNKYPQNFIVMTNENRLKRIQLGNENKNYYNPYQAGSTLGLASCKYLEELDLTNCLEYFNGIDLSDSPQIKKVRLIGSSTSNLILPVGGILEELRVPPTVKNLIIDSHSGLTNEKFTYGFYEYAENEDLMINGQYVNDYSTLEEAVIIDTPLIDSYEMATNAKNLESYCFKGVNWEITKNDEQYCRRAPEEIGENDDNKTYYEYVNSTYQKYTGSYPSSKTLYEKVVLLEGNEIHSIPVLDYLLTKSVADNYASSSDQALTGTLTLKVPGATVSEFELYQKYHSKYPDLKIEYDTENMTVIPGYFINFYNIESLENISGATPYYSVMTNGEYTLEVLTSEDGPNAEKLVNPEKASDTFSDYTFSGIWLDADGIRYFTSLDIGEEYNPEIDILFSEYSPKSELNLRPKWTTITKTYRVEFRDENGDLFVDEDGNEVAANNISYGQPIINYVKNIPAYPYNLIKNSIYGNDNSTRYAFQGWISKKDYESLSSTSNPTIIEMNGNLLVSGNSSIITYYAYYKEEDSTEKATHERYFYTSLLDGKYYIHVKEEYKEALRGKITLPKLFNGNSIYGVGEMGCANMLNVTHFYFQNKDTYTNNNYSILKNDSFAISLEEDRALSQLVKVDLPRTIQTIGDRAFIGQIKLLDVNILNGENTVLSSIGDWAFAALNGNNNSSEYGQPHMKIKVEELPINLLTLGTGTFYLGGENIQITKIPPLIKILPSRCFFICPNVNVTEFGIVESNHAGISDYTLSALETIRINSFYASGNNVTTIHIHEGIKTIESDAFRRYGNNYDGIGGYEKYTPLKSFVTYTYGDVISEEDYADTISKYIGVSSSSTQGDILDRLSKNQVSVTKES